MPFPCSICGEEATRICVRCTKDACDNHLCEKCRRDFNGGLVNASSFSELGPEDIYWYSEGGGLQTSTTSFDPSARTMTFNSPGGGAIDTPSGIGGTLSHGVTDGGGHVYEAGRRHVDDNGSQHPHRRGVRRLLHPLRCPARAR